MGCRQSGDSSEHPVVWLVMGTEWSLGVHVLLRLGSETSPDVLCWYVDKLWGDRHDCFTRDIGESWASECPGQLNAACWCCVVMTVSVHGKRGGMCCDLEHVGYKGTVVLCENGSMVI